MSPFFHGDPDLEAQALAILESLWQRFPTLGRDQIALSWLVYDPPVIVNTGGALTPQDFWQHPIRGFHYRGDARIYPASVVKLFYLVAMMEWLERGMIQGDPDLDRALRDMIIDSSNDATSLIVDLLTGTTSGPTLPSGPQTTWAHQRNMVNRYYQTLKWSELAHTNINQKPWGDGPYGRERVFLGPMYENRNMVNTNAVARLLHSIVGGVAVSPRRCHTMMELLQRTLEPVTLPPGEENQVQGFLGEGLPRGSHLWSKAGWTSQVRHDAAYIEPTGGDPFLLVVFTEGKDNSQNREILPAIAQAFCQLSR